MNNNIIILLLYSDNDKACWDEFTCHGLAYGLVGLFQDDKLILIKQNTSVGRLPFGSQEEVFKIQKICVVPLQSKGDPLEYLGLDVSFMFCCFRVVHVLNVICMLLGNRNAPRTRVPSHW